MDPQYGHRVGPASRVLAVFVRFASRKKVTALLLAWLVASGVSVGVLILIGSWTMHTFASHYVSATAIGVDSQGNVRIAYSDRGLQYTTNAHGTWSHETLDSAYYVGPVSLAVGSADRTHIVYDVCNTGGSDCRSRSSVEYVTDSSGLWTRRTLDANGEAPSLVLGPEGSVYVAYMSRLSDPTSFFGFNLTLRYATNVGGSWTNGTAWGWPGAREYPPYLSSIAVGPRGALHIAFTFLSELMYLSNESGSWNGSYFRANAMNGEPPVLAADSIGRLHLAFSGVVESGTTPIREWSLIHAVRTNGNWSFEAVDRVSDLWPSSTAMALDTAGHVHVVYSDRRAGVLKYATNRGGAWTVTTIERGFVVGYACAIALDALDRPHVAYVNFAGLPQEGGFPPPYGGRYATTIVNSSNLLDFLLGAIPLVLSELILLTVAAVVIRSFRRRSRSRGASSAPRG